MKKIVFLLVVIVLLVLIANTIYSLYSLWSKKDVLSETREQLAKEQQTHAALQKQWQVVNTQEFIEEQARDKLFMGKPGDVEVFLPPATPSASAQKQLEAGKPVWLQWWEEFF